MHLHLKILFAILFPFILATCLNFKTVMGYWISNEIPYYIVFRISDALHSSHVQITYNLSFFFQSKKSHLLFTSNWLKC
jgi:hypothetical protein